VPNVAARLEGLCKELGCEAVVSHTVCVTAGIPLAGLPQREATVRGRRATLRVHPIREARQIAHRLVEPADAGS
jgi:adenylate cyclase